jgi:hypothetical protein
MSTIAATLRPIPFPSAKRLRSDPVAQAFTLLRLGFFALPVLMGVDKFAKVLNDDWPAYLASQYNDIIPGSAQTAMYMVGVVEILAGIVVLVAPRFGGLLVSAWLAGIIASLLLVGGYGDIALRDFGLLLGGLTLSTLAGAYVATSDEWGADSGDRATVRASGNGSGAKEAAGSLGHAPVG